MLPHTLPPRAARAPLGVGQVPILGQSPQQPSQSQMQAAIGQAAQGLSMQVYAIAAAVAIDEDRDTAEHLHQLARRSMTAARRYFEGLGLIEAGGTPEGQDGAQTAPGATE